MIRPDKVADSTQRHSKIQSLEGLRALMAWWVVLGHVSLTFDYDLPIVDRNTLAVDVFVLRLCASAPDSQVG